MIERTALKLAEVVMVVAMVATTEVVGSARMS